MLVHTFTILRHTGFFKIFIACIVYFSTYTDKKLKHLEGLSDLGTVCIWSLSPVDIPFNLEPVHILMCEEK